MVVVFGHSRRIRKRKKKGAPPAPPLLLANY